MKITSILYLTHRNDWRTWLQENHQTEPEIWLAYPRKDSGKPRISYNHAVEEALCFGWIDSVNKTLDKDSTAQRFTPRQPKSGYSQTNIERLRKLIPQGKVLPEVVTNLGDLLERPFHYPADIMTALQDNPQVWQNFQSYSDAYQRIRIAYIDGSRKRDGAFEKRLANLIKKTAQNRQFGFNIEDYY
jgi:uncharacterized protein YdeI (YjbR/CyaY-like superfamily)